MTFLLNDDISEKIPNDYGLPGFNNGCEILLELPFFTN